MKTRQQPKAETVKIKMVKPRVVNSISRITDDVLEVQEPLASILIKRGVAVKYAPASKAKD